MKKKDGAGGQKVQADPERGSTAVSKVIQVIRARPPVWGDFRDFRGKSLRIPDTTPEQLAKALLRGGAEPRPKGKEPGNGMEAPWPSKQ